MKDLLDKLVKKNIPEAKQGTVASYIPELDKARKDALGLYIIDVEGNEYYSGDWDTKFTIQSISKIVTLMLAILDNGEEYVFSKVGMEPTGDPFNSIKKLETSSRRKPYNPLINAGAIAIASMIKGKDVRDRFQRLLDFFRKISEDETLDVNYKIYCGESETGNRNRAMGYFLKGDGIIEGNVEDALDIYFKQCSIEVTAKTLAKIALFLANNGKLSNGETVITPRIATIVKTLMVTCGMYTECSFKKTSSCSADSKTICQCKILSFSCVILLYSDKTRCSFSSLILTSYCVTRCFRSDHCNVNILWWFDASKMNIETMSKH